MIRSTLFYRSKTRANVRAMKRTLSRAYAQRKPARAGTVITAGLINVAGMEYPSDATPGSAGTKVAIVNVGRPAAAIYAPGYGQSTAGIVGSPTSTTTITSGGAARSLEDQAEPDQVIGIEDATIDALAAAIADTATIQWTHTGNAAARNEANTLDAEIVIGSVESKHLYNMAQATVKGRQAGAGTGEPDDLTANELAAVMATATSAAFFGETPISQPTALTAADAGAINSGDATTDGVIGNMRTRLGEIESKLQALGLIA